MNKFTGTQLKVSRTNNKPSKEAIKALVLRLYVKTEIGEDVPLFFVEDVDRQSQGQLSGIQRGREGKLWSISIQDEKSTGTINITN